MDGQLIEERRVHAAGLMQDLVQTPARVDCQLRVLQHQLHRCDAAAIRRSAVDLDGAVLRLEVPREDACQRGLATTARAAEADDLTGADVEFDTVDDPGAATVVAEADVTRSQHGCTSRQNGR